MAGGIPRSLAILSHLHHRAGGPLAGVIPLRLAGFEHTLFELLTGAPPPGDSSVIFQPHTHDGENGVAIPRGTVWCWDGGENTNWRWTTNNTGGGYWRSDMQGSGLHCGSANDGYPANLYLFGSPGVDSSLTAVSTSPVQLEVKLFYETNNPALSSIQLRNRTTGTYSALTSLPNSTGWISLTLDTKGGVWNAIDVEAFPHSPATSAIITVYALVIAETRATSQPQSAGSHTMAAAPKP